MLYINKETVIKVGDFMNEANDLLKMTLPSRSKVFITKKCFSLTLKNYLKKLTLTSHAYIPDHTNVNLGSWPSLAEYMSAT